MAQEQIIETTDGNSPDDAALLDVAARLLRDEDDGLTMDRLAAASGVSRATLYRRFGSRRALVQRLIRERGLSADELLAPDVRTRVVQAARTVFGRDGFAAATVEQIAQEAGVGPATIYRHFGSKEGLVQAFIQASSPRRVLRELAATRNGDLETDLTQIASIALRFIHDNRDLIQLALQDGKTAGALRSQLRVADERTAYMIASYLERQMAAGRLHPGDPVELSLTLFGMLFGRALLGDLFYGRPLGDIAEAAHQLVTLFLHGAAVSKERDP